MEIDKRTQTPAIILEEDPVFYLPTAWIWSKVPICYKFPNPFLKNQWLYQELPMIRFSVLLLKTRTLPAVFDIIANIPKSK